MKPNTAYDKAVIFAAIDSMPEGQLEALAAFFSNLSRGSGGFWDTMSDGDYAECLAIAGDTDGGEWRGLDAID